MGGAGWECEDSCSSGCGGGGGDEKYLFHVRFRHVDVSVHPLKVLLRPVGLLAVPLEPPLRLRRGQGGKKPPSHTVKRDQTKRKEKGLTFEPASVTSRTYASCSVHCAPQRVISVSLGGGGKGGVLASSSKSLQAGD